MDAPALFEEEHRNLEAEGVVSEGVCTERLSEEWNVIALISRELWRGEEREREREREREKRRERGRERKEEERDEVQRRERIKRNPMPRAFNPTPSCSIS